MFPETQSTSHAALDRPVRSLSLGRSRVNRPLGIFQLNRDQTPKPSQLTIIICTGFEKAEKIFETIPVVGKPIAGFLKTVEKGYKCDSVLSG